MSDFLATMAALSQSRVERLASQRADIEARASALSKPPPLELSARRFDVIAEVKLISPADGRLASEASIESRVMSYERGGALAISVLTEPSRFGGSISHLATAADATTTPVMRKDFLVDPVQVLEARAAGAGGVLLIAAILDETRLRVMSELALDLGMFVVVEVFDAEQIQEASVVFDLDVIVGVNSRDLRTLRVDLSRFEKLRPSLPNHLLAIAESGVGTPEGAATVAALEYDGILCGSALMTDPEPLETLGRLLSAGRGARSGQPV